MRINLFWKTIFLILIPLVFEIIFVGMLINLSKRAESLASRIQDSQAMVATANRSLKASVVLQLEVAHWVSFDRKSVDKRPAVMQANKSLQDEIDQLQSYSRKYRSNQLSSLIDELCRLKEQTMNRSIAEQNELKSLGHQHLTELEKTIRKITFYTQQQPYIIRTSSATDAFIKKEEELSSNISAGEKRLRLISQILLAIGISGNICIAVWLNREFNKQILRRIERLVHNAASLAAGKKLTNSSLSHDEIGQLDMALHKLDAQLSEAREREQSAFNNAVDLICSISEAFYFLQMSPSCKKQLGESAEKMIGRSSLDACFDNSDRSALSSCFAEAKGKSAGATCELALRSDQNTPVHFICSTFWSAEESSFFCVFHNITERKKVEEKLRASQLRMEHLADRMPAGLILLEQGEQIASCNEFMSRLVGLSKEQLLGASAAKVFAPDSYLRLKTALETPQSGNERLSDLELCAEGGSPALPVELLLSPFANKAGHSHIAVIQDMREEKEVERLKREFLATLTHDIRTPLSSVRSSICLLETGRFGELGEYIGELRKAEESCSEIIDLVNGILELARLSSGKAIERNESVDITELCSELTEELAGRLEGNLSINYQANEILYCLGNLPQLSRMLESFFKTAIARAPKNTDLGLRVCPAGEFLRIEISERGERRNESERNLIIHGVGRARSLKEDLEFSIALAINQAHGGSILLEEDSDGQNTLVIVLPCFNPEGART